MILRMPMIAFLSFVFFSVFQLFREYLFLELVSPVSFGYVTFHIFVSIFSSIVSIVWYI